MSDWSQQSRSKIMLNNRKACSSHKLSTLGSCYSIIKMREQIKIHSIVLHCFVVQSALSFQGFVSKPEFEAYCFVLSLKPSTKNSCNDPKDFVIVPKRWTFETNVHVNGRKSFGVLKSSMSVVLLLHAVLETWTLEEWGFLEDFWRILAVILKVVKSL